ncbi:MAG TPA: phosphate ABC transporter substrate-binding protein [Roseiflexaceae bacterium]|nr:phosphate ABC transporter substrate-binding protein [Roseiflexaceae bacterium]
MRSRCPSRPAAHGRSLRLRRLLCGLALLAGLVANSARPQARLTITGSTSMTPFVEQLAEHYQRDHPGTSVDVQGLGSSAGIRAAAEGVSELGMSSRALDEEEAAQLVQALMARDALAVIVHPTNPVQQLTREQILGVFTGAITAWDALGGPPRPIVVASREVGSGTFSAFEELVLQRASITPAALRQGSNGAIRQIVADDSDAIGDISLGIGDQSVRGVAIDGVPPSVAEVEAGAYRLMRPFLIVWRKGHTLSPLAASFLDYVLGPEGQAELARAGLVPGGKVLP